MSYATDTEILRLAAGHYGAVRYQQLIESGVSSSTISRRVAAGLLRPVGRGVYVVPVLETENSVLAAAQLQNPTATISHRSAARLHAMAISEGDAPEITVPRKKGNKTSGLLVHESRWLPSEDIMVRNGLRLTTPARTLIDLCTVLEPEHYLQLVKDQLATGMPSAPRLVACHRALARRGRDGTVAVRDLISHLIDDQPYVASELEWRTYDALTTRGIHYLRRQFAPPWYNGVEGIVDFADPVGRTILEVDGRAFHRLEIEIRRDRARDRQAGRYGWFTIRVGWHEVVYRTDSTMDEIIEILEQRRNTAA